MGLPLNGTHGTATDRRGRGAGSGVGPRVPHVLRAFPNDATLAATTEGMQLCYLPCPLMPQQLPARPLPPRPRPPLLPPRGPSLPTRFVRMGAVGREGCGLGGPWAGAGL